jgi:hypothetical protein
MKNCEGLQGSERREISDPHKVDSRMQKRSQGTHTRVCLLQREVSQRMKRYSNRRSKFYNIAQMSEIVHSSLRSAAKGIAFVLAGVGGTRNGRETLGRSPEDEIILSHVFWRKADSPSGRSPGSVEDEQVQIHMRRK